MKLFPCSCELEIKRIKEVEPIEFTYHNTRKIVGSNIIEDRIDVIINRLCNEHKKENLFESFWTIYNTFINCSKIFNNNKWTDLHIYYKDE